MHHQLEPPEGKPASYAAQLVIAANMMASTSPRSGIFCISSPSSVLGPSSFDSGGSMAIVGTMTVLSVPNLPMIVRRYKCVSNCFFRFSRFRMMWNLV